VVTKQQKLESRLFQHRKNKSNIKILELKLESLELKLNYHNTRSGESRSETLEGMAIKAQALSHAPRSITNKFNSVVENCVLHAKKEMGKNKFDTMKLIEDISILSEIIFELRQQTSEIDELLNSLGDKQYYIIYHYYVCKIKDLEEISVMYCNKFSKPIGIARIKQLRFEALQEMQGLID
jgi:hypothetical protein